MAQRYARLDVDFFHKRTAQTLLKELGLGGPLVFVALILRAKDGIVPGTFTYTTEAVGWEKLGFDGVDVGFTLDEFFKVTGRLRQTSRTSVGRQMNVKLSRYADWQKDAKRYEEAAKKARTRGKSTGDTEGTQPGTGEGQKRGPRSRPTSTPQTPQHGKNGNGHTCPLCGTAKRTTQALAEHLENVHGVLPDAPPAAATAADDDIPF